MRFYRNIEALSSNQCCSRKAVSITCCDWVTVALGILHSMRMRQKNRKEETLQRKNEKRGGREEEEERREE